MKKNENLPTKNAVTWLGTYPFYEVDVKGEKFFVFFLTVTYAGASDNVEFNHDFKDYDSLKKLFADYSKPHIIWDIQNKKKDESGVRVNLPRSSQLYTVYRYPITDFVLCAVPQSFDEVRNPDIITALVSPKRYLNRFVQYPKKDRFLNNSEFLKELVKFGTIFVPLSNMVNQNLLRGDEDDLIYRDVLANFVIENNGIYDQDKYEMLRAFLDDPMDEDAFGYLASDILPGLIEQGLLDESFPLDYDEFLKLLSSGLFDDSMIQKVGPIEDAVDLHKDPRIKAFGSKTFKKKFDAYMVKVWKNLPAFISKYI